MSRAPAWTYLLLLAAAFLVGLVATVAASQALVSRAQPTTTIEKPAKTDKAQLPITTPVLHTIEC